MGSGSQLLGAGAFLIQTLFGLYILVVMLRFLLQLVGSDPFNPLSQLVLKLTNPVLAPTRNIVPRWRNVDIASLLLMLPLKCLELWLIVELSGRSAIGFVPLVILAVAELVELALFVFMFAIIIQVVVSWVAPGTYNPMTMALHRLTEPLLGRARRLIPPVAGLDLSPIAVLIVLQLLIYYLLVPSIRQLAAATL